MTWKMKGGRFSSINYTQRYSLVENEALNYSSYRNSGAKEYSEEYQHEMNFV